MLDKLINLKTIRIYFPISLIILGFLIFLQIVRFTVTGYFITINFFGVVLGMATYLFVLNKPNFKNYEIRNEKLLKQTTFAFSSFIFLTIISIYMSYVYRIFEFYIFITIAMAIIAFQSLFFETNKKTSLLILTELIILDFFERISLYLINGVPPWWDPYYHYNNSVYVYSNGYVGNFAAYSYFPLYYILNAITWLVVFGNLTFQYMVINALILSISLLFCYILAYRISKDQRISLISTIFFSLFYSYISTLSYTPHPFSFMLFLISIYFLIKSEESRKYIIGLVISSISMFLFHPSAGLVLAIIMLAASFLLLYYNRYIKIYSVTYFGVVIFYLFFFAYPYLSFFLRSLVLPSGTLNPESPSTPFFVPTFESMFFYTLSHIWYSIIAFVGTISLIHAMIKNKNIKVFLLVLSIFIMVLYNLGSLFSGTAIAETIAIGYVFIFASIISGFIVLNRKALSILLLILIILSFFSTTLLTDDGPYLGKYSYNSQGILYMNDQSNSLAIFAQYISTPASIFGTIDPSIIPYYFNGTLSSNLYYYHLSPNLNLNGSYVAISIYSIDRRALAISQQVWYQFLLNLLYKNHADIVFNDGNAYLIKL